VESFFSIHMSLAVTLHASLRVDFSSLLFLYDKLCKLLLITGTHSSRVRRLVIVTVHMADTILQNASSHAKPMKQSPVKEVCPMLCLTLDVGVRSTGFCLLNAFTVMSHKNASYVVLPAIFVICRGQQMFSQFSSQKTFLLARHFPQKKIHTYVCHLNCSTSGCQYVAYKTHKIQSSYVCKQLITNDMCGGKVSHYYQQQLASY
jgi:hypothetical protein